jgi:mono/diheme cytochrome c family protein
MTGLSQKKAGAALIAVFCAAALLVVGALAVRPGWLGRIAGAPAPMDEANWNGGYFELEGGAALYQGICQGCHMADAKGAVGAGVYPALANNHRLARAGFVIHMVLKGRKGMPPLGGDLNDQQVADVVNYVRSHFGNHYPARVTAGDVRSRR